MSRNRQETQKRAESRRKKKRNLFKLLAAAILCAAVLLGAAVCLLAEPIQARLDIQPDKNARTGTLHAGEIQEVAAGDFWVVMNQIPMVAAGNTECSLEYENPESNHYSARVNLYLKSTGEHLGGTLMVEPGSYVETIELKKKLSPGEYTVTAKVELLKDKTPAGGMSLDITLRVVEQLSLIHI